MTFYYLDKHWRSINTILTLLHKGVLWQFEEVGIDHDNDNQIIIMLQNRVAYPGDLIIIMNDGTFHKNMTWLQKYKVR